MFLDFRTGDKIQKFFCELDCGDPVDPLDSIHCGAEHWLVSGAEIVDLQNQVATDLRTADR